MNLIDVNKQDKINNPYKQREMIDKIVLFIKNRFRYSYSVMFDSNMIRDFQEFAKDNDCKDIKIFSNDMSVFSSRSAKTMKEGCWYSEKDQVVLISCFHVDFPYEHMSISTCGLIIAKDENKFNLFIDKFKKYIYSSKRGKVMNEYGYLIDHIRPMDWGNLILPNDMIGKIKSEIDTFFSSEKEYIKRGLDWKRGLLFTGKPGNGKTAVCRAIATNSKVPMVYFSMRGHDLMDMVISAAQTVRENSPCILVIEDADCLASNLALRAAALNMIDGFSSSSGVLTIASTNNPDKLDEAFTGRPSRFDSFYVFEDPGAKEREFILFKKFGDSCKNLTKNEMKDIVKRTDGLSAAFVQEVAVSAILEECLTKKSIKIQKVFEIIEKVKKHIRISKKGVDQSETIGFSQSGETSSRLFR